MSELQELNIEEELDGSDFLILDEDDITCIEIGTNVKRIEINAIDTMINLKTVSISNTVTYIEEYAISYNENLISLILGNGIKIIEKNAFKGNNELEKILFIKGIKQKAIFGSECFYKEKNLLMVVDVYYSNEDYDMGFLDNYVNYPVNYVNF